MYRGLFVSITSALAAALVPACQSDTDSSSADDGASSTDASSDASSTVDDGGSSSGGTGECRPPRYGSAFSIDPLPGDESAGTSSCTVVQSRPDLVLDCTGAWVGMYTVHFESTAKPSVTPGATVEVEYSVEAEVEWLDQWLNIKTMQWPFAVAIAADADTLTPPGATMPWWPTNVSGDVADLGCELVRCDDGSGLSSRPMGLDLNDEVFAPGDEGPVPGKFGGELHTAHIAAAREGACGITLGDQETWFSYSLVTQ